MDQDPEPLVLVDPWSSNQTILSRDLADPDPAKPLDLANPDPKDFDPEPESPTLDPDPSEAL